MFLGSKMWLVRRADNVAAIYESIVLSLWDARPVTVIAFSLLLQYI
jgi:hypothetical protein